MGETLDYVLTLATLLLIAVAPSTADHPSLAYSDLGGGCAAHMGIDGFPKVTQLQSRHTDVQCLNDNIDNGEYLGQGDEGAVWGYAMCRQIVKTPMFCTKDGEAKIPEENRDLCFQRLFRELQRYGLSPNVHAPTVRRVQGKLSKNPPGKKGPTYADMFVKEYIIPSEISRKDASHASQELLKNLLTAWKALLTERKGVITNKGEIKSGFFNQLLNREEEPLLAEVPVLSDFKPENYIYGKVNPGDHDGLWLFDVLCHWTDGGSQQKAFDELNNALRHLGR